MKKIGLAIGMLLIAGMLAYFGLRQVPHQSVDISTESSRVDEPMLELSDQNRGMQGVPADLLLFATSVKDAKAIVQDRNAVHHALSVGDSLAGSNLVLAQVSTDKVVLRDASNQEIFLLYMVDANGKSKLQKLAASMNSNKPNQVLPAGI